MSQETLSNNLGKHYHFDKRFVCNKCATINTVRIDPYCILSTYKHIVDPEHQHAAKKLLRCGQSKAKDIDQDIAEVILTLQCWQRRREEEKQVDHYGNENRQLANP